MLLLRAVWIGLVAVSVVTTACKETNDASDPKVLFGRSVTESNTGPEKVSTVLLNIAGKEMCTGTIIASDLILTASHCLAVGRNGFVAFGLSRRSIKQKISFQPAQTKMHSKFRITSRSNPIMTDYDVAMIKLNTKIPAGYRPVKLLKPGVTLAAGTKVKLAGYGVNETGGAGVLKTDEIAVRTQKGRIIVAGKTNRSDGSCFGDSGGPLFVNMDGEWQNAGIVSQSPVGIFKCGYGTYYASVSANYDDILSMAKQLTGRANPFEETSSSNSNSNPASVSSDLFLNLANEAGSDSYTVQVAGSLSVNSIVLCENVAAGQCQPNQVQAVPLTQINTSNNRKLFQTSRAIDLAEGKIISAIGLDQNQNKVSQFTIKIVKN